MSKIGPTSPDRVKVKLVKYRKGDCLSIVCENGYYLGVLISEKFNKYYDLTFLEYYKSEEPILEDFLLGRCFGTRSGSWEEFSFTIDKRMFLCEDIDNNSKIKKTGSVNLIEKIEYSSYAYLENISQLQKYFLDELPIRIEKTKNAEKFPELAFYGRHLIEIKNFICS